jgi:hypothetical protein
MDAFYPWQAAYLAAVCETADSLMDGRILEARAALEQRLLNPIEGEEYRAISSFASRPGRKSCSPQSSLGCSYIGQHGRPILFILGEHGPGHAGELIR